MYTQCDLSPSAISNKFIESSSFLSGTKIGKTSLFS